MIRNLFTFISLLTLSCNKSPAEKDTIPPVVTLSTPANGQVFSNGQTIPVNGSVSDDKYIAEIHIHVSNLITGTLLMDVHRYPNGPAGNFAESFTATAGTTYKIQVIAKDRAVNETTTTIQVSSN